MLKTWVPIYRWSIKCYRSRGTFCGGMEEACDEVSNWADGWLYCERAKEGYEEQIGRECEKALDVTSKLIMAGCGVKPRKIELRR